MEDDYLSFMLWKAGLLVLAAFLWGLFCGLSGRSMRSGRRDTQVERVRDRS